MSQMTKTSKISSHFGFLSSGATAGAVFMVLAGLAFAATNVLTTWITYTLGLNSASAAFWQYFFALIFSLPWIWQYGLKALRTERPFLHILRVILAVIGVQFWTAGFAHGVPLWQMIALDLTSPFFVLIGAWAFLGEAVSLVRWAAIIVGISGGVIILAPWSDGFTLYSLLPVGAALAWAGTSIVTKKLTVGERAETITLYLLLLLTPANAAFAFAAGGLAIPTGLALGLLVISGLAVVLSNYLLTLAYARADAAYVQPFDQIKLPINVLASWLIFSYAPNGYLLPGAILILGASWFLLRHEARAEKLANGPLAAVAAE